MNYETAKEFFNYDPETGVLTWRIKTSNRVKIGDVAGALDRYGYRAVKFKEKRYLAHRIAWLLTHKKWPKETIDHINGVPDDNRIINLREANQSENGQNMKSRSNTGVSGVSLTKDGYYTARLMVNGKLVLATEFKNFDDAVAAVTAAKRIHHTFHPELVLR
jgi:hypothetical protein